VGLNTARDFGPKLIVYFGGWENATFTRFWQLFTVYILSPLSRGRVAHYAYALFHQGEYFCFNNFRYIHMKYWLLLAHIIFSSCIAQAQFDSLAIEIYAQVPTNGQNFDLANTFGIKLGKINSHHKFSLGYGTFKTRSSWVQYYDDNNSRWTTNSLILHSYSDSMPANARRGKVTTTSYAINVSWSREPAIRHISLYSAISFTAFINQIKQTESSSLAYITDGIEGNTEIE